MFKEKVRKEVFEVLGPEANPTPRDLSELKYTEMVVKESSRLFPLAGLLARSIEEDILIGDLMDFLRFTKTRRIIIIFR